MMLRRVSLTVILASFSTSCTVTKDPINVNYTALSYSVALQDDKQPEHPNPSDIAAVAAVPREPAASAVKVVGCTEFKLPFLGKIPVITQEEINKTRGDDRARQRQLIEHIEALHRFTVAEQERIRAAARAHRNSCSK